MKALLLSAAFALGAMTGLQAQSPADLSDLEFAHAAYTAGNIDIRYAHLAMALSDNPDIRAFATTMLQDHTAVNDAALELLEKQGASPIDNFLSQSLLEKAAAKLAEMSALSGEAFDLAYAENELAYHQTVNGVLRDVFIPNAANEEVRALFETGLEIFLQHEGHAQMMVDGLAQ